MPRGPRSLPECGVFHITIRGNNKRCIFRRDCEFRYFKKLLFRYKKKFAFLLYHYTLMKNHVHLCIYATKKTNVSKLMQGLQLAYSHYQRKRRGYIGHLWQGRFNCRIIKDDRDLLAVGQYIERNPVKAGIAKNPADYLWSSYRFYALGDKDSLVDVDPLYKSFGESPEECQVEYQKLMRALIREIRG